jgi:hypothetical protein
MVFHGRVIEQTSAVIADMHLAASLAKRATKTCVASDAAK